MINWTDCSCQPSTHVRLGDIKDYARQVSSKYTSPIDSFYDSTRKVIQLCKPEVIDNNSVLGPLLLVAFISSTENYFRHLFSLTVQICHETQRNCHARTLSIGTVLWHNGILSLRSLLENASLTSIDEIKRSTKDFAGLDLSNDTKAIAEEYVSLCQIRHNIVHSDKIIAGKNAIALRIPRSSTLLEFTTDFALLQTAFEICTSFVTSVNKELFKSYCERWAVKWCRDNTILKDERLNLFKAIWDTFHSVVDDKNMIIVNRLTMNKCMKEVLAHYQSAL